MNTPYELAIQAWATRYEKVKDGYTKYGVAKEILAAIENARKQKPS